ncbi:MAG: tRNA-guanine(15) transglycosylase, partial [Halobacteriaceae archaeon]
ARGVARLADLAGEDATLTLAHRGWPTSALDALPESVRTVAVPAGDADGAGEDRGAPTGVIEGDDGEGSA